MNGPDIILSAIMFRLFAKPIEHGAYIGPRFLHYAASYWSPAPPKLVFGEKKIVFAAPLECDASLVLSDRTIISMVDMIKCISRIPFVMLESRSEMFLRGWYEIGALYPEALTHQTGVNEREFDHMYRAFGPGAWSQELLVRLSNG